MKYPNHIILDFEHKNSNHLNSYWALQFFKEEKTPLFVTDLVFLRKFTQTQEVFIRSKLLLKSEKYTIDLVRKNPYTILSENEKKTLESFLRELTKKTDMGNNDQSSLFAHNIYSTKNQLLNKDNSKFTKINGLSFQRLFTERGNKLNMLSQLNLLNIFFLRKERLYTKLKYSRSPAYDIVSGGAAALLAGLLGFLISEKFGIELVDSGDFYYVFMYLVFIAFSIRPILIVWEPSNSFMELFNLKIIINFYIAITATSLRNFKNWLK